MYMRKPILTFRIVNYVYYLSIIKVNSAARVLRIFECANTKIMRLEGRIILFNTFPLSLFISGSPKILIFGESGGTSRHYQLAPRFGLCDLVAEREGRGGWGPRGFLILGESVDQGVVLHKGCARSRTSLRLSASVLLDVVEAEGEDLDEHIKQDLYPVSGFVFVCHNFYSFFLILRSQGK